MSEKPILLLDVPKDSPTRKERLKAWKDRNKVWTHSAGNNWDSGKWVAIAMKQSCDALKGYGVAPDIHPMDLVAGYCRLLDEAGLMMEGDTELGAIEKLCRNVGLPCPNSPRGAKA